MNGRAITLLIAGFVAVGIVVAISAANVKARIDRVEGLCVKEQAIIAADSVRDISERLKVDSLRVSIKAHEAQIDELKRDLTKTRKQNAELEKRFKSITVSMPEF
jgi:hypothetical protein